MPRKLLVGAGGAAVIAAAATLALVTGMRTESSGAGGPEPGILAPQGMTARSDTSPVMRGTADSQSSNLPSSEPVVVHFAEVVRGATEPDGTSRTTRRREHEGIVSETEMAELRAAAYRLPPEPSLADPAAFEGSAPTPGAGFDGVDYSTMSAGSVPPDPVVAASGQHVVTAFNSAIEIFDTTGTSALGPVTPQSFFATVPQCTTGIYDPDVVYDEEHDRFVLGYVQGFSADGGYCLAATQTSDPTGNWYVYFLGINTVGAWVDFAHLGIADDHVVIGANTFTFGGSFAEGRVWAVDKNPLYAGGGVLPDSAPLSSDHSSPQPLHLHGIAAGTWPAHGSDVYVIGDPYDARNVTLFRWNVATGVMTEVGDVDLGSAGFPVSSVQNGTGTITANDARALGFEFHDGYGWTAMNIGCNPGTGTVNCIRWVQIDLATATPGPAGVGVIAGNGEYRTFPALAVNRCGDMAVGYTITSPSTFPGVALAGRRASDPPGTVGPETLLRAGQIEYTAFDGSPYRWGDYTGMAVAPDGLTLWYVGQYSKNTGTSTARWGTWVVPLTFPACGSPGIFADGFEGGDTSQWSTSVP